jgi:hypothetical protein
LVGINDAIQLTSLIGQKGPDYNVCVPPFKGGTNVLSVTYSPSNQFAYPAWEDGQDETWTPAACMPYVELDMSKWYKSGQNQFLN